MVRKHDQAKVIDCKVTPGEPVVAQHRLFCMKFRTKSKGSIKKRIWVERIKRWKLKTNENKQTFKEKGNDRYTALEGTANEKWEQIKNVVIKPAEEICGKCKGGKSEKKEMCKIRSKRRKLHLKNGRPRDMHKRREVTTGQKERQKMWWLTLNGKREYSSMTTWK